MRILTILLAALFSSTLNSQEVDLTRSERIYGLSQLWAGVKRDFVNYDKLEFDWDSLYLKKISQVSDIESTYEYFQELRSICAQLKDGHTKISLPRDIRRTFERNFPIRSELIEDRVIITDVYNDSLVSIGFKKGMEIVKIDNIPVHEYAKEKVMPYQSSSTKQDLQLRTYTYNLFYGHKDKKIKLTLKNEKGNYLDYDITRKLPWNLFKRKKIIEFEKVKNDVGILTINGFDNSTFYEIFDSIYPKILETSSLIIDIRNNGGGSSTYGYYVLGHLVSEPFYGTYWYSRQHISKFAAGSSQNVDWFLNQRKRYNSSKKTKYKNPVVLLIGRATFSAAEDFAAIFDNLDIGKIIGEPSGGSSGEPARYDLPGGGVLRVCTERNFYPDGTEFVGVGIIPDKIVLQTVSSVRENRDLVLEEALKILDE